MSKILQRKPAAIRIDGKFQNVHSGLMNETHVDIEFSVHQIGRRKTTDFYLKNLFTFYVSVVEVPFLDNFHQKVR